MTDAKNSFRTSNKHRYGLWYQTVWTLAKCRQGITQTQELGTFGRVEAGETVDLFLHLQRHPTIQKSQRTEDPKSEVRRMMSA